MSSNRSRQSQRSVPGNAMFTCIVAASGAGAALERSGETGILHGFMIVDGSQSVLIVNMAVCFQGVVDIHGEAALFPRSLFFACHPLQHGVPGQRFVLEPSHIKLRSRKQRPSLPRMTPIQNLESQLRLTRYHSERIGLITDAARIGPA